MVSYGAMVSGAQERADVIVFGIGKLEESLTSSPTRM